MLSEVARSEESWVCKKCGATKPKSSKIYIWYKSSIVAAYEVLYIFLPILIWWFVSSSIVESEIAIAKLIAWPFASLALYSAAIKDGFSIYDFNTPKDKSDSKLFIILIIIGLVLSSVLLTLAIASLKYGALNLSGFYDWSLAILIIFGAGILFYVKNTKIQREDFGHRT